MYHKIFSPVYLLLLFQLLSFYLYDGYLIDIKDSTFFLISGCYLVLISTIVFGRNIVTVKIFKKQKSNKVINLIVVIWFIFFIIKPALVMYFINTLLGADYIRINFFNDKNLQVQIFGSMFLSSLTMTYILPISWFLVIFYFNYRDKFGTFLFYFMLLAMVIFNMSYAGRFNMYFAMLLLFLREISNGYTIYSFLKKYSIIIISAIFYSFTILLSRQNKDFEILGKDWLMLLEYHNLQPFFMAQKIDLNQIVFEGYPFRVILTSFLSPIYYIFGYKGDDLAISYYPSILNDFTLFSSYTNAIYNAYGTFIIYLYTDFGIFTPVSIFFVISFFILISNAIKSNEIRLKYIIYLSFLLYASLFQTLIFSQGALFVLICVPAFYLFISKQK